MRALPPVPAAIWVATAGVMPAFLTGALAVQMRSQLHFGAAVLGLVIASFFASAACFSVLLGSLSDRWGPTLLLRAAVAISSLSLFAIALLVHSVPGLILALAIAGMANAAIQPATNRLLASAVPAGRQGFAFGIKQAAIPTATFLAGLSVPAVALTVGWRYGYASAAVLAGVVVPLVPRVGPTAGSPGPADSGGIDLPPLLVLTVAIALGAGAANAMGAFLVSSATGSGVGHGDAGLLAAAGSLAGLGVRVGSGWLADRRSGRHLNVVAGLLGIGVTGYLLLAVATATRTPWLLLPAALIAFGAGWGWNGLFAYAVVRLHPGLAGRATGITQSGTYLGSVIGPLAFGLIAARASFAIAWSVDAGVAALAAVCMLLGRHMFSDRIQRSQAAFAAGVRT